MSDPPDLVPGDVAQLSPLVRRVLAPNPGMMTGPGTNTYLLGRERVAVIDPGPDDPAHLDAVAAAGAEKIEWILVTHTHSDHSPGAAGLKERTGAAVLGFGARDGFEPDRTVADGWLLDTGELRLRALHTPGHASNHLCYLLEEEALLFSGDHIMSGSTVVIAPPDGDMTAYLEALEQLRTLGLRAIAPGHGSLITDPAGKIDEYVTHRLAREAAIAAALETAGEASVEELVSAVYTDVAPVLHPVAQFSVWAHLRRLAAMGRASVEDPDDLAARWRVSMT